MVEIRKLSEAQLDALKEMGNIGSGNAATALSSLVGDEVEMTVPEVAIIPIEEIPDVVGGPEEFVFIVYIEVLDKAPGTMLFLIPEKNAFKLADMLSQKGPEPIEASTEISQSALKEVGSILSGSYLSALSQATGLLLTLSVPALASDMAGAILDFILIEIGQVTEEALYIKTDFTIASNRLDSYLFFLPHPGSLDKLLGAVGMT